MILNFGSINIDHVYSVPHMPAPGETLSATDYNKFLGGKGVNQSVAAHKAGAEILHAGAVGDDGAWALERIVDLGLRTDAISESAQATGNAVIYVDNAGENQIVILGGANLSLTLENVCDAIEFHSAPGDWVILQNETNLIQEIAVYARDTGRKIAYSAAPFIEKDAVPMIELIDLLAVNEGEAAALSKALGKPLKEVGLSGLLITKGADGAALFLDGVEFSQAAFPVNPVDTTGAGDTFVGSLVARLDLKDDPEAALRYAAAASALQVTRPGAASAIPEHSEVIEFLKENA